MELWYFTPLSPERGTAGSVQIAALTQRLTEQYGADFHITVFLPEICSAASPQGAAAAASPQALSEPAGTAQAQLTPSPARAAAPENPSSCESNGCTLRTFETETDPHLCRALGEAFRLSYEMHLAARKAMEKAGKPDAILFPLADAAPYYTLLYRYLDSAFWADCPVFIEDDGEDDGAQNPRPEYLLPYWWIVQQQRFCRMAASGVVSVGTPRPANKMLAPSGLTSKTPGSFSPAHKAPDHSRPANKPLHSSNLASETLDPPGPENRMIAPSGLANAVRAAKSQPFAPTEFPFLTVRPQTPVPMPKLTCAPVPESRPSLKSESPTESEPPLKRDSMWENESLIENTPPVEHTPGLLTVIIPYYNLGKTLPETLESAFASDHPNFEVLLIDDGSTDAQSVRVLREMEQKYPSLRVVRQENAGLSAVRNRGAALARGEYITFLDADDCVAPDFYRRGAALLDQYQNAAYVSCWLRLSGDADGYKAYFPSCLPLLLLDNMQASCCVIRRRVFLACGKNEAAMRAGFEDHESWIHMAECGYFGINIPEPLYTYRLHHDSASAAFSREENHERHIWLYQVLEKMHPSLYKEYSTELYNLLMANGPGYLWAGPALSHAAVGYLEHSDSFWRHELALARADADNYKKSHAYRLGDLLLHPVRSMQKKV